MKNKWRNMVMLINPIKKGKYLKQSYRKFAVFLSFSFFFIFSLKEILSEK